MFFARIMLSPTVVYTAAVFEELLFPLIGKLTVSERDVARLVTFKLVPVKSW